MRGQGAADLHRTAKADDGCDERDEILEATAEANASAPAKAFCASNLESVVHITHNSADKHLIRSPSPEVPHEVAKLSFSSRSRLCASQQRTLPEPPDLSRSVQNHAHAPRSLDPAHLIGTCDDAQPPIAPNESSNWPEVDDEGRLRRFTGA
jgi:hypothetical protein